MLLKSGSSSKNTTANTTAEMLIVLALLMIFIPVFAIAVRTILIHLR